MASAFMWTNNINQLPEPVYFRVGGEMFKSSIGTLTKYPDSVLANMCKRKKAEEPEDFMIETIQYLTNQKPKTEASEIIFSLDYADPEYFRAILYFLRLGEITWKDLENKDDPNFHKGVLQLANSLGLKEHIWEALHTTRSMVISTK